MFRTVAAMLIAAAGFSAQAADAPAPVQANYIAHDFHFHDGQVTPSATTPHTKAATTPPNPPA